ncbi:MAG: hypothetical protein HY983_00900 [Candidatus Magasanikbacteria bacterium]|nr:hypothetical protein [Candidatus Magasanikbacteria bacterium]
MKKRTYKKDELEQPVTLGVLLEYTDSFLMPKMVDIMDERFAKVNERFDKMDERFKETDNKIARNEYNLKVYIDEKLANYTSDIFKRLEKKQEKETAFKKKVVDLFKKHHIGSSEELAFLEGLVSGS